MDNSDVYNVDHNSSDKEPDINSVIIPGLIMERNTIKNFNIALLSISFMMVFTGFNTMSGIQVSQLRSGDLLHLHHHLQYSPGDDIQICHDPGQWRIC